MTCSAQGRRRGDPGRKHNHVWHPANEARSDLTELAESELNKRPKLQSHTSAQFHPVGRATRNVLRPLNRRFNGLAARCWNLENAANGARILLRWIVGQSSVTHVGGRCGQCCACRTRRRRGCHHSGSSRGRCVDRLGKPTVARSRTSSGNAKPAPHYVVPVLVV